MALYLIGCSDKKHTGSLPAIFKYTPRQHGTTRDGFLSWAWATGHTVAIVSAKHGLVEAATPVADYDQAMTSRRASELATDQDSIDLLHQLIDEDGGDEVYVYGGKLYRKTVKAWIGDRDVDFHEIIGQDRGCGDHYSALQELMADNDD